MVALTGIGVGIADAAPILKEHFEPVFTDAMDRDNFLYSYFPHENGVGDDYQWKIHFAGNTSAGSYSEWDEAPASGKQSYIQAKRAYAQNMVVYGASGRAIVSTRGRGADFEELTKEASEAVLDLKDTLNDQMLANATAKSTDIDGIGVLVSDTGTYAGIDRTANVWFKSYVTGNGGTPRALTISLMQDQLVELEKPSRKARVSAVLCAHKHYNDYGNLLQDQRRFVNTMKLDAGTETLAFENIPVIKVPNMATGNMFFVDKREWLYVVWENFTVEPLPVNGDAQKFFNKHYSQLVCKHTGRQGKITDLS